MSVEQVTRFSLGGAPVAVKVVARLYADRHSWDTKRHSNAEYELHILLKGRCTVNIEAENCTLEAGHALLIAPGQYHMPVVAPGEFERLSLPFFIGEGRLARLLRAHVERFHVFIISSETVHLTRRIFDECGAADPFRDDVLPALYMLLLADVFRTIGLFPEEKKSGMTEMTDLRTSAIDDFFEKHFAEYGTEKLLAESLHLSKRQLARVLNEKYGMSFREKLLSTRMDYAGWLLRTTDRSVSEIVAAVGYSSEGSFFKMFRVYYSTTPQKYRAAFRKGQG